MLNLHDQEIVFYYDREEIENLAAAVEARAQLIYSKSVREGDEYLPKLMEGYANIESNCRDLLVDTDRQNRNEPLEGGVALDRDATRHILYGILHAIRCLKDGKEETLTGEEPHIVLTQMQCGLWIMVDRWEEERRQEVYDRVDRLYGDNDPGVKLLRSLEMPADWNPTGPVPEE